MQFVAIYLLDRKTTRLPPFGSLKEHHVLNIFAPHTTDGDFAFQRTVAGYVYQNS